MTPTETEPAKVIPFQKPQNFYADENGYALSPFVSTARAIGDLRRILEPARKLTAADARQMLAILTKLENNHVGKVPLPPDDYVSRYDFGRRDA
ncbi:hypothetical protein [Filomicrobium sp.]|uniref:hypothetical protein n=1 Tax=Filomicrobium sp. TaxID=2024831 RepID=UPI0025898DF2|nr:hypothetical protein [Filomicrobium sp.]MCV0371731.1 hypothetical protein [Filomicrobium sp.]